MQRITVRMPAPEGVAPGQTGTFRLPIGRTYHTLLLTYAGVTLAQMTEIRLVVNGSVHRRFKSGTIAELFNLFAGHSAAGGILRIDFDRPNMRLKDGEEYTALGTGFANDPQQVTTLALEVDIDPAAVAPVLSLKAVQSEPRPFGRITKTRIFNYAPTAGGDFEIADLPKGELIGRIYFEAADISKVKIEADNFVKFERTTAENEKIQTDGYRVPQAGLWVFDPSELGYAGDALETAGVQDLRITVTKAAPGALPVHVEYIGFLDR